MTQLVPPTGGHAAIETSPFSLCFKFCGSAASFTFVLHMSCHMNSFISRKQHQIQFYLREFSQK